MNTIALALLAVSFPAFAPRSDEVSVTLKGRTFTTDALPVDLGEAQKHAILVCADWAKKSGYRMDFDAQARLLLVTHKDSSRTKRALEIVGKTETWFDTVLPAPPRAAAPKPSEPPAEKKPGPGPIPEDPEDRPGGAACLVDTPQTGGSGATARTWGSGSQEPDSATAVLIVLHDERDHASLLDELARTQAYLKDWAEIARQHLGFVIEEPLAGAYVENADGQEEWNPDHELVNRVAQLMILRRFGQQPNWLVQGLAFEAERAFDGTIYCFPFRKEFVYATEHTSWPNDVKNDLKARPGQALDLSELVGWKRNTWDARAARLSWALARQLLLLGPGRLSATLEDLRVYRDLKDRRPAGATGWERVPGWDVPIEAQAASLSKHFGDRVVEQTSTAIRTGKDSKPPKPGAGEKRGARAP